MLVSDIINIARHGELQQLALKDDNDAILSYINMGVLELYKRFKVQTKVEIVRTSPIVPIYTLINKDIIKVIDIYDADGRNLTEVGVIGNDEYDIKQIGQTTFMLKTPKEEDLAFVYTSAPELLTSINDEVELPGSMIEALLHYIGYRAHGSIDGNVDAENNTHYMRFEKSCNTLANDGYGEVVDLSKIDTRTKGFV